MGQALKDKVAIITGAGRGIGKAFALRFAAEGARLLLPDISPERAEGTAREIRERGGEAVAMATDISEEGDTRRMAEKVMALYGRVDVLLNNAALFHEIDSQPWDGWTVEEWDRTFAINVRGTWLCCRAVAPLMARQGGGKIINIVSDIIRVPGAQFLLAYACSKGAVYTMTQALARALGPDGINVNAIGPGLTATEGALRKEGSGELFRHAVGGQAIGRREEPEDLAGTAVFLASADAGFITGQFIIVDGGNVMG